VTARFLDFGALSACNTVNILLGVSSMALRLVLLPPAATNSACVHLAMLGHGWVKAIQLLVCAILHELLVLTSSQLLLVRVLWLLTMLQWAVSTDVMSN